MCELRTQHKPSDRSQCGGKFTRGRENGDGDGEENEETRERNTMTNGTKGNGRKMRANQLAGWNSLHGFGFEEIINPNYLIST